MSSITPKGAHALAEAYATLIDKIPHHHPLDDNNTPRQRAMLSRELRRRYPDISTPEWKELMKKSGLNPNDYSEILLHPKEKRKEAQDFEIEARRLGTGSTPMTYTRVLALTDPEFIRYYAKRAPEFIAEYLKTATLHPKKLITEWDPAGDFNFTNIMEKTTQRAIRKANKKNIPRSEYLKDLDSIHFYLQDLLTRDFEQNGIEPTVGVRTPGEQNALKVRHLKRITPSYMRDIYTTQELDYTDESDSDEEKETPTPPPAKKARGSGMKRKKTKKY